MVRHTVGQDGDKYRMLTHSQWNRMVTKVTVVTQTVGQNDDKYRINVNPITVKQNGNKSQSSNTNSGTGW